MARRERDSSVLVVFSVDGGLYTVADGVGQVTNTLALRDFWNRTSRSGMVIFARAHNKVHSYQWGCEMNGHMCVCMDAFFIRSTLCGVAGSSRPCLKHRDCITLSPFYLPGVLGPLIIPKPIPPSLWRNLPDVLRILADPN